MTQILLVSGSTRAGSTNTAALRAAHAIADDRITTDWTVGGPEMYGKPVAWINVAPEGRGEHAEASLRTVLGYVGTTIVEPAVTRVPVGRADIDATGDLVAGDVRDRIEQVVRRFADALQL